MKSWLMYLHSKQVFPTPVSPTSNNLNNKSYLFDIVLLAGVDCLPTLTFWFRIKHACTFLTLVAFVHKTAD